jgi:DNA polymerase-3 subunit chi
MTSGHCYWAIQPYEKVMPRLVEKVVQAGHRLVVYAPNVERMQQLDQVLWTFASLAFVPHGCLTDPFPEEQPVLLMTPEADGSLPRPVNGATMALWDPGVVPSPQDWEGWERIITVIEMHHEAHRRWQRDLFRDRAEKPQVWQQQEKGWQVIPWDSV